MKQKHIVIQSIIFLIILCSNLVISAQTTSRFTVSGYVYEKNTRETLIGVNIYEPKLKIGSSSNIYGYYAINLPADSIQLIFSYIGYKPVVRDLDLRSNIRLDVELEGSIELEELIITDKFSNRISQIPQMSQIEIPVDQARKIPSLLGEKDMFKVIQLMPGVQLGTEGSSGFYVRGGSTDQNLIILDDAIVYNANHLFGFFSVFNGDAIKNMQLFKGGFPARYGGRLSSVLDIQMKDGSKEKIGGEAGIGLISSRLTLEGPIIKDKASFLVSGRRTYIDAIIKPFMPKDSRGGYFFYDLNTKLNYEINQNNRIYASGYFGRDKFFFQDRHSDSRIIEENEGGLYWQNKTSAIRWNHIFHPRLFSNTSFIFSDYSFQIYSREYNKDKLTNEKKVYELRYKSGIQDIGIKYDLSWHPVSNHQVRAGIQFTHHLFTPSAVVLKDDYLNQFELSAEKHRSVESGIYVEDEINIGEKLKINPGIRYSYFFTKGKNHQRIEPRFSLNFILQPALSYKLSYAAMNQYVHLLSTTGIGLPTDLWVPSTDRIKPQNSWQAATGFAYNLSNPELEISLEGYYKKSKDIIGYKEGASFLLIDDPSGANQFSWQDNITAGQAWAYGIELLIQRKTGQFSGWIGYTLSWIQHQFNELNFGEKFFARYDRRHDISLVGIYEFSKKTTLSATWVYSTGNAFDLATGRFPIRNHPLHDQDFDTPNFWWNEANIYDKKNSFRAASYQRLDIGIQFHKDIIRFGHNVKRTVELGAYNAYSRKNPFFYFWETYYNYHEDGYDTEKKLKQVSLFPIIPSIQVNYKF